MIKKILTLKTKVLKNQTLSNLKNKILQLSTPTSVYSETAFQKKGFKGLTKMFSKDEAIVFAGGCFWGVEKMFMQLDGVLKTKVGYAGGSKERPTYEKVTSETTNHAESVEVLFNPNVISLQNLIKYFFQIHDPTTSNKQGNDIGTRYRSAIFCFTESQKNIAEQVKLQAQISGVFKNDIVTEIEIITIFWEAEEYHQQYLIKNSNGYCSHYFRKNQKF